MRQIWTGSALDAPGKVRRYIAIALPNAMDRGGWQRGFLYRALTGGLVNWVVNGASGAVFLRARHKLSDLAYIFSIGFSGADLWRAVWLALFCSLFASRKFRPWKVCIIAFAIDRIWPFYAMSLHGYEWEVISASVLAALRAIPDDIAFLMIRYLGFLGLIYLGFNLRLMLHDNVPEQGRKGRGVLPY